MIHQFEIVAGKHTHGDGKIYVKGDVIHSADELDKIFKNKFRRLRNTAARASVGKDAQPAAKPIQLKLKGDSSADKGDDARGSDVTKSFALALEQKLKVFRRGGYYHVFEDGKDTPINEKGVKKTAVEQVIQNYLDS